MTGNLGATTLKRRRRAADPMQTFDTLPAPLRQWLAEATLPWSPASCQRIWVKSRRKGLETQDVLALLTQAEQATLAREGRVQGVDQGHSG
ncbi:hypothetical protein SAMN06273572_102477 [Monaibacterium marinum]|uniref:Uncharacterized protein n=1 Tax=Pontivivens marinum TaxID=1690039 RepID=A0A2C9CTT3_9RHOB|nr:DUF6525 family protein [Monaibacterium marinum]SOH93799.1 hypothetical protein SAMN06273572_102477 [Monaibacterium marinum]